jgi:peptidoglycan/LPS O-acetylase OafA/YrhL
MKMHRPAITLMLAALAGGLCLYLEVKDGGNIDYYWKPSVIIWLLFAVAAFATRRKMKKAAWIADQWWLSLVVPIALFFLAVLLVRIHKPYPLGRESVGRTSDQSTMPEKCPASNHRLSSGMAHS